MTRRFRVELHGDEARLGLVPAADVARLLLGVERAIARQAAHALGRPAASTGRWETVIANAARIRLAGIEEGSVVPVLELPDFGVDGLALEAQTLGEDALESILDVISGSRAPAPDVAQAFVALTDALDVGGRYESIVFDHTNGGARRVAVIDAATRTRLREAALVPDVHRESALRGTLVEADFERLTARLRTATGEAVSVTFPLDLADAIEEALRRPAELEGQVTYDPETAIATAIRLEQIHRESGLWDDAQTEDYWARQSLIELQHAGVAIPVSAAHDLYAPGSTEGADLDAFFAAIADDPG